MFGDYNDYFAEAIAIASRSNDVEIVPFTGLPWIEVDTADDLERAERVTMARILKVGS